MKQVTFRERVLPSIGFYIASLLLPLGVWLVFLPINSAFGIAVATLCYLLVLGMTFMVAPVIEIMNQCLRVGRATIDIAKLGNVQVIEPKDAYRYRNLELDARTYTKFQLGVKGLVRVEIVDKYDPTPYWLFSVRNPQALVSALDADRP